MRWVWPAALPLPAAPEGNRSSPEPFGAQSPFAGGRDGGRVGEKEGERD